MRIFAPRAETRMAAGRGRRGHSLPPLGPALRALRRSRRASSDGTRSGSTSSTSSNRDDGSMAATGAHAHGLLRTKDGTVPPRELIALMGLEGHRVAGAAGVRRSSGATPRTSGEARGEGEEDRRDPRRALSRAADPARAPRSVHAARGRAAVRADDRRAGQQGHARAVRTRIDAAGDGEAERRRDPRARSARAASRRRRRRTSRSSRRRSSPSTAARCRATSRRSRPPRRRPQDRERRHGAGVRRAGVPRRHAHPPPRRALGPVERQERRADRARPEEGLPARGVDAPAPADHLLRPRALPGARPRCERVSDLLVGGEC